MSRLRVEWRASVSLVGTVLRYLSVPLTFPLAVALFYGEDVLVFVATIVFVVGVGVALERLEPDSNLGPREGFLMVALTWLAVAVVGTLPYVLAGNGTIADPFNALFESMSGFTTTGATVMGDISFDTHSRAVMMWRQLTQWLGGMGIVVLAVAILPELSVGGAQLMDAEAPGPGIEKLTPRIAETARVLWIAYIALTALEVVSLYALYLGGFAPNMTLYNAIAHAMSTMPTGGFSPEARSIEAFSAAVQWVIVPFMVAAGVNFALVWQVVDGNPRRLVRDGEFRAYVGLLGVLSAVIGLLLFTGPGLVETATGHVGIDARYLSGLEQAVPGHLERSLRDATFQVVSIMTTTGYASVDFNAWSDTTRYLLVVAMLIGGSAGSTGGAIKVVRWVVIAKSIRRELFTTVHPEAVRPVRLGGRALDERAVRGIYAFTVLYLVLFLVSILVLLVDADRIGSGLSAFESMSAVAATLGNVGPGFGTVGPMQSYLGFSWFSKLFMVFLMWVGRLEILPVLVLLTGAYWRS